MCSLAPLLPRVLTPGTPGLVVHPAQSPASARSTSAPLGHHLAAVSVYPQGVIQRARVKQPAGPRRKSARVSKPPQLFKNTQVNIVVPKKRVVKKISNYEYVLPQRSKVNLKGRSDKTLLEQHFGAIEDHYETYKKALARSIRLGAQAQAKGNKKLYRRHSNLAKAAKGKMTEAIGEINATNKILAERGKKSHSGKKGKQDRTWLLKSGFSPGSGIDQIWQSKGSGNLHVVEAKGPGATLGSSAAKGGQMSKQWVAMTAESMLKKKGGNDFGILKALKATAGTKDFRKVRGYIITSTPKGKQAEKNWQKLTYN